MNRQKVEAKHHKPEEVGQVLAGLRQAVQASPLAGRDLVAELIAERRAEALLD